MNSLALSLSMLYDTSNVSGMATLFSIFDLQQARPVDRPVAVDGMLLYCTFIRPLQGLF